MSPEGMRDVLVHDYFGVDLEVVWRTIQEDLSRVLPLFQRIREQEAGTPGTGMA